MLHLQRATVVIAAKIGDAEHLTTNRWSFQKQQGVIEKLRSKLFKPNGGPRPYGRVQDQA